MKKIAVLLAVLILFPIIPSENALYADDEQAVEETVKIVLNSIRYGKHDLAVKYIDFTEISRILMQSHWDKMSSSEKQDLIKYIEILVRKLSFPEGKKMFRYLDAVLYGKPKIKDSRARCKATIVVHRNYKKQENIIDFELKKKDNHWKIVEMHMLGEPVFEGIYEDEVSPILKKGGVPAVMKAIRKKIDEVSKSKL